MSQTTPILGRDALLSLIDWGTTMRRKQDEGTGAGDSGNREAHSGGSPAAHRGAAGAYDSSAADSEPPSQHGGHTEEEA